jgi:hypothetical protein
MENETEFGINSTLNTLLRGRVLPEFVLQWKLLSRISVETRKRGEDEGTFACLKCKCFFYKEKHYVVFIFLLKTLDLFIYSCDHYKLNTFVRDSSPNQIGTPLSRRSSHTTQSGHRQTTAIDSRLLCDALFVPQHHCHKLVILRTLKYAWGAHMFPARFESGSTTPRPGIRNWKKLRTRMCVMFQRLLPSLCQSISSPS